MRRNLLAEAADRLLSLVPRDPEAPHYSEESFRRKESDSNKRARSIPLPREGKESNCLLLSEWREVVASANLTERQAEVLAMRLQGLTFEEIGAAGGHSKQGAQNVYFQAAKKLVKAWMGYPYRGLAQVYREEIRRGRR